MARMHRTQILLERERYDQLKVEAERTGKSIGELVRETLAEKYDQRQRNERLEKAFDAIDGIWADMGIDGEEYVERLRPGMEARAKRLGWE